MRHSVLCGNRVEVLVVEVALPNVSIGFYCLHSGAGARLDMTELLSLAGDEPSFIGGDFNTHHER